LNCPNCGLINPETAMRCDCGYEFLPGPTKAPALLGREFGIRAVAYVIDMVVLFLSNTVTSFVVGIVIVMALTLVGRRFAVDNQVYSDASFVFGAVTSVFYFVLFEWIYGATPGKLIFGLRVVQTDGRPCRCGAACVRGLLRFIDSLVFALPAYFSMKSPLYQRLGDKAAHTLVVGWKHPAIQNPRAWWWILVAAAAYLAFSGAATFAVTVVALR
jgi:uncharacterized RDD family membrane protein YckC